jgi:hypothetical protein
MLLAGIGISRMADAPRNGASQPETTLCGVILVFCPLIGWSG